MNKPFDTPLRVGRECYLRTGGRTFVVEVLGLAREAIWVSYPASDELAEGTGVQLAFYDGDDYVSYHARVSGGPSGLGRGLMLERSEAPTNRQRRRDWRVPVDFPVWLRRPGSDEKIKGRMMDLTANGTLVVTPGTFQPGDVVEMIFQLPEYAAHRLKAQIVYLDTTGPNGANRLGLRFVEVKRRAKDAIVWFLYDRIQRLYTDDLRELYPPAISRSGGRAQTPRPAAHAQGA